MRPIPACARVDKIIPKSMYDKGIKYCYENAKRLIIEAVKAFNIGLWTSSYLMGFYSYEEIAKAFYLIEHYNNEYIAKEKWREITSGRKSHLKKITMIRREIDLSYMAFQGFDVDTIKKFRNGEYELVPDAEFLKKIHDFRTRGLYVGYNFDENKWDFPDVITDELAITMIHQAGDAIRTLEIELEKKVRARSKN